MKKSKSWSRCLAYLRKSDVDYATIRHSNGDWEIRMRQSGFLVIYDWLVKNGWLNRTICNPGWIQGYRRIYRISNTYDV